MAPLRWAIVSAGTISHDFACAVSTLPAADHQLVAVGARGLENARKFAELHGIPRFYEGYEAIAKDPEVDVVYVGTVNNAHYEVSRMMLEAGKHVLCEKPLCVNRGQARALLDFARERGRFCMEAIWSRFFPSYIHLRERIGRGDLGRIERVEVQFGFPLTHVERVRMKSLGGGTVLDLGVYTIQVAMWAFQAEPVKIEAAGQLNDEGVDVGITAKLHFPQGGVANIRTSAIDKLPNTAVIIGTKGSITLHDFCTNGQQIGGTDVSIAQYPFVAGILLQRSTIIGNGAILSPNWVLTSASAVYSTPDSDYSIATGSEELFTPAAQYQVQRIFRHPEFVGWDYNVALVKVSGKIVFGDTVQPIAIATTDPETVNDATMLSYGKNEDGTSHLRSATYTLISDNDDCVPLLQEYQAKEVIWQHHGFCLIPPPGTQQGQWYNDAGAPLVADGQLYAVFAFAENEGGTNEGSVATRLTSFAGWIQSIMFSNR